MFTFADSHVSVLDDGPTILIENVFLAEATERALLIGNHHVSYLIERAGPGAFRRASGVVVPVNS